MPAWLSDRTSAKLPRRVSILRDVEFTHKCCLVLTSAHVPVLHTHSMVSQFGLLILDCTIRYVSCPWLISLITSTVTTLDATVIENIGSP